MVGSSLKKGVKATMVLLHKSVTVEILCLQERGGGPLVSWKGNVESYILEKKPCIGSIFHKQQFYFRNCEIKHPKFM